MENLASCSAAHGDGSRIRVTTDMDAWAKPTLSQQQSQNAKDDPSRHSAAQQSNRPKLRRPLTAAVLDLQLLDEYLLKGFLAPTLEQTLCSLVAAVSNNSNNYNTQLTRWIRTWTLPLLGTLTLLWSHGQLPTTRALGLAMVHRRSSSRQIRPLLAYAALRYGLPALYQTLRQILQHREEWRRTTTITTTQRTGPSSHNQHISANDSDEKRKQQEYLALQRQCTVLTIVLEGVDRILPCLRFACLVQCWTGWSTTPDPAMILTGWEYCATNLNNNNNNLFNTQYAHRRWLWEQGWETLQLWLAGFALVRSTWSPWIETQVVRPVTYVGRRLQSIVLAHGSNPNQRHNSHCPLCRCRLAATAVVVQAQPCGHLYCYVCLYRASTHPKKFSCHVCGTTITKASPV